MQNRRENLKSLIWQKLRVSNEQYLPYDILLGSSDKFDI